MITQTDCRSDEGIVVGLIDGMIASARIIRRQCLTATSISIVEALKDLV